MAVPAAPWYRVGPGGLCRSRSIPPGKIRAVEVPPEDLRIDVIHVKGGGPCAVRITHLPTQTVVFSDGEASTEDNRDRAMERLSLDPPI